MEENGNNGAFDKSLGNSGENTGENNGSIEDKTDVNPFYRRAIQFRYAPRNPAPAYLIHRI